MQYSFLSSRVSFLKESKSYMVGASVAAALDCGAGAGAVLAGGKNADCVDLDGDSGGDSGGDNILINSSSLFFPKKDKLI